jgi:hypothetical protein
MDIGSIFLIIALLIMIGLYISRPLFYRKAEIVDTRLKQEDHDLSHLLAERDRLIEALEELDFDHTLGKIPAEEYPAQRADMLKRGADVLRQIDHNLAQPQTGTAEDRLEATITSHRERNLRKIEHSREMVDGTGKTVPPAQSGGTAPALEADDDLEALIASRRRERLSKSAGFCPQCGRAVQSTDRFCPKCGTSLS